MTAPRPDLLPIGKPTKIGLPYHGLVTDGVLDLGGGKTKTHPQPSNGDCWVVKNPTLAHAVALSTEETAAGWQWLQYALISGGAYLGGKALTGISWLYSDANATWGIARGATIDSGTKNVTVTISLTKLFGRFYGRGTAPTMASRQLATLTFQAVDEDGDPLTPFGISTDYWGMMMAPSPDGSGCYFNFYYPFAGIGSPDVRRTYAVVKATISGTGSLVAGSIGSGISGTLEVIARLPELYTTTSDNRQSSSIFLSVTGSVDEGGAVSVDGGNTSDETVDGLLTTEEYTFFYAFDTAGDTLVWTNSNSLSYTVNQGWTFESSIPADYSIYRYTHFDESYTVKCNGTTIATASISGELAVSCERSGTLAGTGSFNISLDGYCNDLDVGTGMGSIASFVWKGETLFEVPISWTSTGPSYWVCSTYGAALSKGSTEPTGNYSYEPVRQEWGEHATKDVCWV